MRIAQQAGGGEFLDVADAATGREAREIGFDVAALRIDEHTRRRCGLDSLG